MNKDGETHGNEENNADVLLTINGLHSKLDNGLIAISFDEKGKAFEVKKNNKNLIENLAENKTSFSVDWHVEETQDFIPDSLEVLNNTTEHVHIMYQQNNIGGLKLEYHLIMNKGICGLYTYVKAANVINKEISMAELRVIYRFNPKLMDFITNYVRQGKPYLYSELHTFQEIQDETFKLPDDTIYSKYDFAGYLRETPYTGVFGNGYGAWLLTASHEYFSGGPLKQDLLVHQDALIANYLTGSHFGTPNLIAPTGWSKLYGPWLMYFNEGSYDQIKADVNRQSSEERAKWPYKWMTDLDYPLERGILNGTVTGPSRSMVVISSSLNETFDQQTLGYSYYAETQENGEFGINNIRPGAYLITAYPLSGYGIGIQVEKNLNITVGNNLISLDLTVPTDVKWSIGETNRRSEPYKYSDKLRNYVWQILPPANLEFVPGESNLKTDWYYAQIQTGTWTIRYEDIQNDRERQLLIGVAAASNFKSYVKLAVIMNGEVVSQLQFPNDKSIYRGVLQSGNYQSANITIPASLVNNGSNILNLMLIEGFIMYDSINFSDL